MPFPFINRRLNVKLNLMLVAAFGGLLLTLGIIVNVNFPVLLRQLGQSRLEDEAVMVERRFVELEAQTLNAARLLIAMPGMGGVFETGVTSQTRTAFLLQASSLGLDNLLVVNQDGDRLVSISNSSAAYNRADEEKLIKLGLIGAATTGLVTADDTRQVFLSGVVPVKNAAGTVIGAVLVGREIDDALLDELDYARSATHLGFVYDQRLVARDHSKPEEFDDVLNDEAAFIAQAGAGQLVMNMNPAADADGSADVIAFVPARVGGEIQGVFIVRFELSAVYTFQTQLVRNSLGAMLTLLFLALALAVVFTRRTITRPIEQLKQAAEKIAAGDFSQRITISSQDELGDLARAFNTMSAQLNSLVTQLQQRMAETQAAREEAERASQVKSAFLASMSHELRTPLNSIINFSKFVVKGVMGPINERQEETLNKVVNSSKHLLQLINDVLDMSKIESGSLNLFVEKEVDVSDILQTVAATASSMLDDKPVELQLEIAEPLPRITGDKKRIMQIMLNVVSNACKFTQEGHVKIMAQQQNGSLRLAVEDTGPGIAPEDSELVFEAFKQTATGLRQGSGTGLGLPISRSLAEAHGGRMWFDSVPGQGSTFYVSLPVQSETLQPVTIE